MGSGAGTVTGAIAATGFAAQRGVRGEHAGIVMPMAARRDQRDAAVEPFERGEGEFGLAAGQGLGEGVADGSKTRSDFPTKRAIGSASIRS
jgi:hypothetical protein